MRGKAGLRVGDVFRIPDDGRPYMQIRVAWRRNRRGQRELGRVKTAAARRIIRIPQCVADLLADRITGRGPDEPVLTMVTQGRRQMCQPSVGDCGGTVGRRTYSAGECSKTSWRG